MRLLSFHADGFGILAQTGAEDLGPGINIFLGDNEAGKSTCLAFLRAMLTGYPSGRKERQTSQPLRGGQAGGSLTLESGPHGLLHLHRRPGPGSGRLQLTGPDGAPVPESLLEQLFRGIDRQVYRNVFGFSLGELQRFESLDDEAVRHALYGASFGTGLRSPADVLRALQQQADTIYRPQGRKLPLNVRTDVWQELRARIRQADAQSSRYDALCAQWQQRRQELENLRRRKTELETSLRRTERVFPSGNSGGNGICWGCSWSAFPACRRISRRRDASVWPVCGNGRRSAGVPYRPCASNAPGRVTSSGSSVRIRPLRRPCPACVP